MADARPGPPRPGPEAMFERFDADGDGSVTEAEFDEAVESSANGAAVMADMVGISATATAAEAGDEAGAVPVAGPPFAPGRPGAMEAHGTDARRGRRRASALDDTGLMVLFARGDARPRGF
jgi:hypothetical protein